MQAKFHTAKFYRLILMIFVSSLLLIIFILNTKAAHRQKIEVFEISTNKPADLIPKMDLNEYSVRTHKGYVTLEEINEKVFKPFGYEITKPTLPIPTLRMLKEPTCNAVFSEWLKISRQQQPDVPPEQVPVDHADEFLLNGYIALSPWYFNDHKGTKGDHPRNWDKISELMKLSKTDLAAIAYKTESESMYHAMSGYRLDGMSGLVVGSMQPWVEVMALQHGARKILTVEYNELIIQDQFKGKLSSMLPLSFVENWKKYAESFDFVASFSSIEHSGLGRYGDPMDPTGDLREIMKIKCVLKKGGLLYLGIPYGTDAMQFNAHRIYGSIRLAMMFHGFELLATFSGESKEAFDLNSHTLHSRGLYNFVHYTCVLRKI